MPDPEASETSPLLKAPEEASRKAPKGFVWIEFAIFANVFLYGFDGTITAATYAVISSDFDAANTASWLTTSYLVTSTAFQPLYGRFSDIFGRRICFFVSTVTFALGCLGCGLAQSVIVINLMRALTGFGGGGLMTMATIINSDMIPFRRRGMYQALQNTMFGVGAIAGASFGGAIADSIGWRWCFLLQVPISAVALVLGWFVIRNPERPDNDSKSSLKEVWAKVDLIGSLVLVIALVIQLIGLSVGGNELPWKHPLVIVSLVGSFALLVVFLKIEGNTKAVPIIPLRMFKRTLSLTIQLTNLCAGIAAYAYLFTLPLFFQVVLLDSAATAGARLAIPSLAYPIGGIVAGAIMSRYGKLIPLVRIGAFFMALGNGLVTSINFYDAMWKYYVFIFPANLGQGIIYPATLFTNLATFEHSDHAVSASTIYLIRSVGSVYGVAITSAIIQTVLKNRLPTALGDVENKEQIIDEIRHSVTALTSLPPDIQHRVQLVYYDGLRFAFAASTGFALVALISSFFARPKGLRSTK